MLQLHFYFQGEPICDISLVGWKRLTVILPMSGVEQYPWSLKGILQLSIHQRAHRYNVLFKCNVSQWYCLNDICHTVENNSNLSQNVYWNFMTNENYRVHTTNKNHVKMCHQGYANSVDPDQLLRRRCIGWLGSALFDTHLIHFQFVKSSFTNSLNFTGLLLQYWFSCFCALFLERNRNYRNRKKLWSRSYADWHS